eukprot:6855414-Prymnesium_polylepis.1
MNDSRKRERSPPRVSGPSASKYDHHHHRSHEQMRGAPPPGRPQHMQDSWGSRGSVADARLGGREAFGPGGNDGGRRAPPQRDG